MPALVAEGKGLRPTRSSDPATAATKVSLSSLAIGSAHRRRSWPGPTKIEVLPGPTVPDPSDLFGVRNRQAACRHGSRRQPERLHSDAAWADLRRVADPDRVSKKSGRSEPMKVGIARPKSALWRSSWSGLLMTND